MYLYAATIFVSAFLLFLVQPVVAKQILPWFGGSAAVWTTCLVFFQTTLLAGYAYSDFVVRRLRARAQIKLHTLLLLASVAVLPIIPGAHWKPTGSESPSWLILGLLAATIGLPYFLLSTTSPLVQVWYARARPGASPYRLFALSNLASMLALVGYPFLFEPWAPTRTQAWGWSVSYVLFVGLCAAAGWSSCADAPADRRRFPARVKAKPSSSAIEAPPSVAAAGALVRARRYRLAAAPRGVEPHHAEHRGRAAPVDRAARDLSPHLHPLLRRQGVVSARDLSRDAGGRPLRHGLDARRLEAHARARHPDRRVLRRALPRLHVLPWRARAAEAGAGVPDAFLPDGVARRRAGLGAGRDRRAARTAGVLRACRRARRRRLAAALAGAARPYRLRRARRRRAS